MGGFPRVVGKEKCIKEESFRFPFGFETATRPWASFSRKGIHAYSSSPPFISLYFFLLSFSFFFPSFSYSPIFQPQFRLTIRRRIEKRAVQTSAGFHQVLISSSFASRRGSRGCASNTTSLSSHWSVQIHAVPTHASTHRESCFHRAIRHASVAC